MTTTKLSKYDVKTKTGKTNNKEALLESAIPLEDTKVDIHKALQLFSIGKYEFVAPVAEASDKYTLNILYENEPHPGIPISVRDEILIDLKNNKLLEYNKWAYSIPMVELLKQFELYEELDQVIITTKGITLDITYRDLLQMAVAKPRDKHRTVIKKEIAGMSNIFGK